MSWSNIKKKCTVGEVERCKVRRSREKRERAVSSCWLRRGVDSFTFYCTLPFI